MFQRRENRNYSINCRPNHDNDLNKVIIPYNFDKKQYQIQESEIEFYEKKNYLLDTLKKFNELELVIKRRVILYTITKIIGEGTNIQKIHIEDIIKLCENNIGNKYLTPNKNIKIFVKRGKIFFMGKMNLP